MSVLDYAVIGIYMLAIALIGLAASSRPKTAADYFVANRSMPAWAVAMTLMATIIGSGTIVGLPGSTYQKGMILLLGNLTLPLVLIVVAKFIVPFYRNVVGMSAYEFIGKRFGLGGKFYASFGFLADRTFDLGVTLVTTAVAVHVMTGWDLSDVILGIALFTVLYTMVGGMEAVVWTSVAQGAIFIGAAILITFRLVFASEVGAPGAVIAKAWEGGRFSLGDFSLDWKSLTDPAVTTQWLFILAYTINWGRRYVADQHMVQRYLIAKTDREASRGALWNALLCVPVWTVFMFIGACLWGYYQLSGEAGPATADDVVPHFILGHMPAGIVGLILAAILAASMSSISADLNSISTVATNDYLLYWKPKLSEKARLMSGRFFVALAGAFAAGTAMLLIPEQGMASIMERAVTIAAILSGGTLGFFLLGFLTRRATRRGCYTGIAACLVFTAWGVLTSGGDARILDLGYNFSWHPIYFGIGGHFILFGVGYLSSLALGGYRPENVEELTFRRKQNRA
ncbi:sodium/solute symporter [Pelagicoccus sp. NFK12]|uniref:Sodium/solute symporter n=1 Tax=Pelagicoccus enzymogenes TaxID=2773457 RepID=A0A927F8R1_9BACT|nr:sodium/solute symporter [Pelagicoccus enzymogenes]MBD5780397.1 sodium/solute symporter [Pelagicoccus enzymogenes]MDQ8197701.1 sodium/solute symporter [Pelagicoccus enzymogenes]